MNDVERMDAITDTLPHVGMMQCIPTAEGHCITCSDEAVRPRYCVSMRKVD